MENSILSPQNEKIKNILKLKKASERARQNLIVVEGEREVELALKTGQKISEIFYCPELSKNKNLIKNFSAFNQVGSIVFKKIAYKENPDGYLALVEPRSLSLEKIKLSKNPLLIILETVEKPGNLGAILRTAYAAKVDAIIINDPQTDIYNPNVIRASMGHIFTNQVVSAEIPETKNWLKKNKITVFGATTKAKKNYAKANFKKPMAFLMGTENSGLSAAWLKNIDQEIKIPMRPGIDSLNVSVSTAILVYEALRQRDFVDF